MWSEAELLKQHGLGWFAWAGMITPVPELCCSVIPRWIPVLLWVPICSQKHFWHSFARMVSVQDCNTLTCWRILFNKPRDTGSHSQTDVLQDEILHPSSGWTSGPPVRKKSTTVPSRIEVSCLDWANPQIGHLPQWGLTLFACDSASQSLNLERKGLNKLESVLGILSNISSMSSYLPSYSTWFQCFSEPWELQFRVERVKPSLQYLKGAEFT